MFVLEYKINNGIWKVQYIHKLTYFVLHDVDFNSGYYFRISAMNAVGRGKPSKVFMVRIGGKLRPILGVEGYSMKVWVELSGRRL